LTVPRGPVFCVPLALFDPVQSPEAVQEVGLLVALQINDELEPFVVVIGLAVNDTTGGGGRVTLRVTLLAKPVPPSFEQVKVKR
jgi:hypothetical protein